jgi:fucose permease
VEAQAIEPFSGARMTSPWSILGLLAVAFVAGAVPTGLLAIRAALGDRSDATAAGLRRNLLVPAVFFLPIAGALADYWGPRDVALFGAFVAIVGLGLTAIVPQTQNALMNLVGVSFGLSLLTVGTITLMPICLAPPGRDVEAMNLGFAAFGLGWLVGPTLAESAVRWGGAPRTLLFQAAALLAVFGVLAAVPLGAAVDVAADAPVPAAPLNVAVDLRFWTLGLVLLLYIPIASSIETWSRPLLRELCGNREPVVAFRQRVFWLAFLAARVLSFWAMRTGLESWVLVACAVAGVIVLGNLAGVNQLSTGATGLTVLGLCFGPLLPGIFGLIHAILPHPGLILGSALGAATLWHLLIDPALARTLQPWSPRQMMRGAMLVTLGLSAMLLLVALMQPEPVTTPRPVHEVAKKDTLRTFLRKLFVRQK